MRRYSAAVRRWMAPMSSGHLPELCRVMAHSIDGMQRETLGKEVGGE